VSPFLTLPLGIKWALRTPKQTLLAALGMAAAVLVGLLEMGFFFSISDGQLRLIEAGKGKIWIMNRQGTHLSTWDRVLGIRGQQAAAVEGVEWATSIYQFGTSMKNPDNGSTQRIIVLAIDPQRNPLGLDEASLITLRTPGHVLFDRLSRPLFGNPDIGSDIWLDNRHFRLAGEFSLGPSVVNDGFLLMGEQTLLAMQAHAMPLYILVQFQDGANIQTVQRALIEQLGDDAQVLTSDQVATREVLFMRSMAPLGLLFGAGMLAGAFIGMVITYQVLYVQIRRSLPAFATLLAMGFSRRFVLRQISIQSSLVFLAGFLLAVVMAVPLYALLAHLTGLPMYWRLDRVVPVFMTGWGVALGASALAVIPIWRCRPAQLLQ
jgi:putative ABC transport system permease protein